MAKTRARPLRIARQAAASAANRHRIELFQKCSRWFPYGGPHKVAERQPRSRVFCFHGVPSGAFVATLLGDTPMPFTGASTHTGSRRSRNAGGHVQYQIRFA
jgi:hypothetical protein